VQPLEEMSPDGAQDGLKSVSSEVLSSRIPADIARAGRAHISMPDGEVAALVGPSGCGKTTLCES